MDINNLVIAGFPKCGKNLFALKIATKLSNSGKSILYCYSDNTPGYIYETCKYFGLDDFSPFEIVRVPYNSRFETIFRMNSKIKSDYLFIENITYSEINNYGFLSNVAHNLVVTMQIPFNTLCSGPWVQYGSIKDRVPDHFEVTIAKRYHDEFVVRLLKGSGVEDTINLTELNNFRNKFKTL